MTATQTKPDTPSDLRSAVDAGRKRSRTILIAVGAVIVAAALVAGGFLIAGAVNQPSTPPAGPLKLTIATSDDSEFQDAIKEVAAEKGLDVEWVNVNDWVLPNTQLAAGDVDGNAFQHILFLSQFNVKNSATLTPVFSTVITQWGIFSKTATSLAEFPDGGRIAIPDDASNGARALFILQAAGLITIKDGVGNFPGPDDVATNPHNFQFVQIAATTIPQQFDDPSLTAVVVGTSYFDPSQGITSDSALFLDDSLDEKNLPYINVVASREDNKDDPAWEILKEAYADPRVAAALEKESGGNTVLVDVPVETLRSKLADLQKEAAANG